MFLQTTYTAPIGHTVTVQWYLDDVALVDGTFGDVVISGAFTSTVLTEEENTATLNIQNPTADYDGVYHAVITDLDVDDCVRQTSPLIVSIPAICRLEITVQPVGVETNEGNTVELTVGYTGATGNVTFQWYRDDVALVDGASGGATISGATSATLTITNSEAALSGNYYVVLTDDGVLDCVVQSATVVVEITASMDCTLLIDEQPEDASVIEGGTLELTFTYTGGVGPFTIQWYRDGVALVNGPSGGSTIAGATTLTLTITNWTPALAGSYTAIVVDTGVADCQAQTSPAVVTELVPPANMYIWYKADGETRFSDGEEVEEPIQDFSGNELDLTVDGHPGAVIPVYETNALNGLPIFDFPGPIGTGADVGGFETTIYSLGGIGFPIASTGFTIACVVKRTTKNVSYDPITITGLDGLASVRARLDASGSDTDMTYTGVGYSTSVSLTVPLDTWQIVTVTFDFAEGVPRIRTNDLTAAGAVGVGTPNLNFTTMQMCAIGAIAEILLYNTALAGADLTQLRTYLSEKWGIAITV